MTSNYTFSLFISFGQLPKKYDQTHKKLMVDLTFFKEKLATHTIYFVLSGVCPSHILPLYKTTLATKGDSHAIIPYVEDMYMFYFLDACLLLSTPILTKYYRHPYEIIDKPIWIVEHEKIMMNMILVHYVFF
ncbi:hypothetical protein ACJX0J_033484, partial [Zea mays]